MRVRVRECVCERERGEEEEEEIVGSQWQHKLPIRRLRVLRLHRYSTKKSRSGGFLSSQSESIGVW